MSNCNKDRERKSMNADFSRLYIGSVEKRDTVKKEKKKIKRKLIETISMETYLILNQIQIH